MSNSISVSSGFFLSRTIPSAKGFEQIFVANGLEISLRVIWVSVGYAVR